MNALGGGSPADFPLTAGIFHVLSLKNVDGVLLSPLIENMISLDVRS